MFVFEFVFGFCICGVCPEWSVCNPVMFDCIPPEFECRGPIGVDDVVDDEAVIGV